MNKILHLTTVGVLVGSLSLTAPSLIWADDNAATPPTSTASQTIDKTFNENALSFIIRHQIGDAAVSEERFDLPFDKLEEDPVAALKQVLEHVTTPLKTQTSAGKIVTQVELLTPPDAEAKIGKLPALTATTTIDDTGAGKTDISLPTFKANDEKSGVQFNLGEMTGHVTFDKAREKFTADLTSGGLDFNEKDNVFNIGKISVAGDVSANLMPSKLDFSLAGMKVIEEGTEVVFENIILSVVEKLSSQGVDISPGKFSLGTFSVTENGATVHMKNFVVAFDGSENGNLLNYHIDSSLEQLAVPAEITMDEAVNLNYVGNLELRNLDAQSLLAIQNTVTDVAKTVTDPEAMVDQVMLAVMGKFMEVLPQVLAASPELAITKLLVNTTQGSVDGQMTVGLDGKKATGIDEKTLLAALVAHSNVTFSASKQFLLKMLATETEGDLKEAENTLKTLIDQYKVPVTEAEDQYKVTVEASFKDGQPTMNDAAQALMNIYMQSQMPPPDAGMEGMSGMEEMEGMDSASGSESTEEMGEMEDEEMEDEDTGSMEGMDAEKTQ